MNVSENELRADTTPRESDSGAAPRPTNPVPEATAPGAGAGPDYTEDPYPPPRRAGRWHRNRSADYDPRRKSVPLACVLSALPGLGQVYVGYYKLGFMHVVVVGSAISMLANEVLIELAPLFGIFLAFFWLYNIVDAGRRAAFYNLALAGMEGVELPDDIKVPRLGGSMVGGLILMIVGFILLSNTLYELPLDWLEDWWPVAPILFGAYLFGRGLMDRAGKD